MTKVQEAIEIYKSMEKILIKLNLIEGFINAVYDVELDLRQGNKTVAKEQLKWEDIQRVDLPDFQEGLVLQEYARKKYGES